MNDIDSDYRCEVHEDGRCRNEAVRVVREPFTPASFKVLCCKDHASDLIYCGYKRDLQAEEQLEADKAREREAWRLLEANPCAALIQIKFCMECRKPTTGSIGQAGYYWPRLCQSCKDFADGVLRGQLRTESILMKALVG